MEYINLHIVVPMSRELVVANFPYLSVKCTQGSMITELTVPSSDDHKPIDIKFQNLPLHEHLKMFLENYAQEIDASCRSDEDANKSWILNLDETRDTLKQLTNVMLQIWMGNVYSLLQCNSVDTEIPIKAPVSEETTKEDKTQDHTVVETPSASVPGEGSWNNEY
ncbi:hypothetical protein JTE90_017580 [Oedothorax gibbosus]|uniref:Uncharacterized protein n=1 Tax=Oedothorax gibbosus TaxID=931172 RepID=A0AAV6TLP7_9ARAC|nr:hypothetical protein JTE90_017580 [Oedothorax gibbosus]